METKEVVLKLEKASEKAVLKIERVNAEIMAVGNAVWGTIKGDITRQADLQKELQSIKDSLSDITQGQIEWIEVV